MPAATQETPQNNTQASAQTSTQTGVAIRSAIQDFLAAHPESVVLEDGRVLCDLRTAQHTLRDDRASCTLHLWSESLNLVRRVVSATPRGSVLRLGVTRLGHTRPQSLELAPARAVRSPRTRETERRGFVAQLERLLHRTFPESKPVGFRTSMDLERSFGPAYARGSLTRGREAWAVVAVGPGETQSTVDGALSVALLWLHHCREHSAGRLHYGGVRVIVPAGAAATTSSRMRWLNPAAARFELYTLDPREGTLTRLDPHDHGNAVTRLVHLPREDAARERFGSAIAQVLALLPPTCSVTGLVTSPSSHADRPHSEEEPGRASPRASGRNAAPGSPSPVGLSLAGPSPFRPSPFSPSPAGPPPLAPGGLAPATLGDTWPAAHRANSPRFGPSTRCEVRLRSSTEVAFLCHGLEFARIRSRPAENSFRRETEITVGHGPEETALTPATAPALRDLIAQLFLRRHPAAADATDPLFRVAPERWLESALRHDLAALDPALAPAPVYTQVPAFTGAGASLDRGMLDLLAATTAQRLAVIEIKADEDLHLAMQGLDYWIRIREHHLGHVDAATGLGDLQQHGYFPSTRLSAEPPGLYLVAPALRIHPATELILSFISPAVPWTLIALDERWRTRIKPIWVRRSDRMRRVDPGMGAQLGSDR